MAGAGLEHLAAATGPVHPAQCTGPMHLEKNGRRTVDDRQYLAKLEACLARALQLSPFLSLAGFANSAARARTCTHTYAFLGCRCVCV